VIIRLPGVTALFGVVPAPGPQWGDLPSALPAAAAPYLHAEEVRLPPSKGSAVGGVGGLGFVFRPGRGGLALDFYKKKPNLARFLQKATDFFSFYRVFWAFLGKGSSKISLKILRKIKGRRQKNEVTRT
jgi:hypothetical protein